MSLQGKIVQLGSNSYGFEYVSREYNHPMQIRQVWKLETFRVSGMSYCQETDAIGRAATIRDSVVSCYLGNGNYFSGACKPDAVAIVCERTPVARPKVRATTELRWHYGEWQKNSKRDGWVRA